MTVPAHAELPEAPTILHIDVAEIVARLGQRPDDPPVPYTALEGELLSAAYDCAAGAATQPPRRELVAVALREVRRGEALRDRQRDSIALLLKSETMLRETQHGLLQIQAELLDALAEHLHCEPSARVVLAAVRQARLRRAEARADG